MRLPHLLGDRLGPHTAEAVPTGGLDAFRLTFSAEDAAPSHLTVAEPKKRRCAPVVVGAPRTVPITPADYQLAAHAIASMIAQWWDANGLTMPDTEQQRPETPSADNL